MHPAVTLLLASGLLLLGGGITWIVGRLKESERLSLWGKRLVFAGLCLDGTLLLSNWIFGWTDLL